MTTPSAAATSMLSLTQLRVEYKSGQSALGHHWKIFGDGDEPIGRTKLAYEGAGGKIGKRLLVATGLSTAGSVTANILTNDGDHIATVNGKAGERKIATLSWPDGSEIGKAVHTRGVDIELQSPTGTELGKIVTPEDGTHPDKDPSGVPYPILDATGTPIGELFRLRVKSGALPSFTGQLLDDFIGLYNNSENNYEAELTRHRGFSSSSTYTVILDPKASIAEPLRTLAILSPVLSGYLY